MKKLKNDILAPTIFGLAIAFMFYGLAIYCLEPAKAEPEKVQAMEVRPATKQAVKITYQAPAQPKLVDIPLSQEYQEWLIDYCYSKDISPYLIMAIMEQESALNPNAMGDNGQSYGLMQIQAKWHQKRMKKLGVTDLLDPYQNAMVGVDYLLELFNENQDVYWVLMAYNGGAQYSNRNMDKPTRYALGITERAMEMELN